MAQSDGRKPQPEDLVISEAEQESESQEGGPTELSRDDIFDVLANRRRRAVIEYLRENDGEATVRNLAEWIAAAENGTSVQQLSSSERKCVYVGLYQNHLPLMDDAGVVDYDDDRKTVELRETVTQLEPYLEVEDHSTNHRLVGGTAIVVAIGIFLGTLQVGIFDAVSPLGWTALGLATILTVAVIGSLS